MLGEIKLNSPRSWLRVLVTEQDATASTMEEKKKKLLKRGRWRLLAQALLAGPNPALNIFQSVPE